MKGWFHAHTLDFLPRCRKQARLQWRQSNLFETLWVEALLVLREDTDLFLRGRIGHANLQQKTVELRLRKRVRAFKLNRVLRGQNRKVLGERITHAVDRYLTLLHRFQECSLGSRR